MNVQKLFGVIKGNTKLAGQLLVDVATHPAIEADLVKVKLGTLTAEQLIENNLPVVEEAFGQFATAVAENPQLLGAIVGAVGGEG